MKNGKEVLELLEELHSEINTVTSKINDDLDSYCKIANIMHKYKMKVLEGEE